jgi:hypothetical protein
MKKLLMSLFAACFCLSANAQEIDDDSTMAVDDVSKEKHTSHAPYRIPVGIETGLNIGVVSNDTKNHYLLGTRTGASAYFHIDRNTLFETGLYYMTARKHLLFQRTLEVPLNVMFRYRRRKSRLVEYIGGGAYIGHTVAPSTGLVYGIGINSSQEWRSGIYLRGRCQIRFSDISAGASSPSVYYGLQIGYMFGKKPVHIVHHDLDEDIREKERLNKL